MLKIITQKEYNKMLEELKAALRLQEIVDELEQKNAKLEEELAEEKDKHHKEAVKKKNQRLEATKKWLNGYPDE